MNSIGGFIEDLCFKLGLLVTVELVVGKIVILTHPSGPPPKMKHKSI